MSGTDGLSRRIAGNIAATSYEELPVAVIEATKRSILDTLTVMIGGSGTTSVAAMRRVAVAWGGAASSTVCASPQRLPDYLATLVNASMVHQLDFDDTHDSAVCHPTAASLPAALAVAETEGGVDGKTLLTAVAVGNDLACRLGLAIKGTLWDYPWVRAPVVGIFAAAAAAGRVLGLPAGQIHAALGLSLPQAAGTLESVVGVDSAVRELRDGLIYKDAVLAARLAREGVSGDARVFEGPYGLFGAYFRDEFDPDVLTDGLGQRFEGVNVSLKPWPSCRHTHATLTALLDLLARPGVAAERIERVVLRVGRGNLKLCEGRRWPRSRIEALCHLPFATSAALAHHGLPLAAFDESALDDPAVLAARELVVWRVDAEQDVQGTIEPGWVELHLDDGRTLEHRVSHALGHPSNPMSAQQVRSKLEDCREYAQFSSSSPEALMAAVERLDELADVRVLAAHLRAEEPDIR